MVHVFNVSLSLNEQFNVSVLQQQTCSGELGLVEGLSVVRRCRNVHNGLVLMDEVQLTA